MNALGLMLVSGLILMLSCSWLLGFWLGRRYERLVRR